MQSIINTLATEVAASVNSIKTAIQLLDDGATVPFIARYRKEATNGLDDGQLRTLDKRLKYLRDLAARKESILASIKELGKLTPQVSQQITEADSKTLLEELYKPFKSKRRTKGQIATEAGLAPLANLLLTQPQHSPQQQAHAFIAPRLGIKNITDALDGAQSIVSEQFADNIALIQKIRHHLWQHGQLESKKARKKKTPIAQHVSDKYSNYFEHSEKLNRAPSHRVMAILRGRNDGALQVNLNANPHSDSDTCLALVLSEFGITHSPRAGDQWLLDTAKQSWKSKIYPSIENELLAKIKDTAQTEAIDIFAKNLSDLLMAAPAGEQVTMGLDPGIRTGVKVAIVDTNSKLLATDTIYPHQPKNQWQQSMQTLAKLIEKYQVSLISIGNGTGSRETERLVNECKNSNQLSFKSLMVSEAGASVYSASESAAAEFPQLDVSLRGAVSIARRLQDPLAELVKIEPKAIGVGQYQHDVNQTQLIQRLDEVVEDCVNAVGIDLNMASAPLLCHVSGLNQTLANNIIEFREQHGRFERRSQLLKVPRLGPKAYEQAAGFLRINQGAEPLDASAVHPESYPLVKQIAKSCQLNVKQLMRNSAVLSAIRPEIFVNPQHGLPTITDVLSELEKPGRDPRPEFSTATFKDGIESIKDLEPGMRLEGVVSNVTNFGAFVDIGVHQDGLVHISALADHFISDPRNVVKAGQVVKVTVTEVDAPRKRIALSMKKDASAPSERKAPPTKPLKKQQQSQPSNSIMAAAFSKAKKS